MNSFLHETPVAEPTDFIEVKDSAPCQPGQNDEHAKNDFLKWAHLSFGIKEGYALFVRLNNKE